MLLQVPWGTFYILVHVHALNCQEDILGWNHHYELLESPELHWDDSPYDFDSPNDSPMIILIPLWFPQDICQVLTSLRLDSLVVAFDLAPGRRGRDCRWVGKCATVGFRATFTGFVVLWRSFACWLLWTWGISSLERTQGIPATDPMFMTKLLAIAIGPTFNVGEISNWNMLKWPGNSGNIQQTRPSSASSWKCGSSSACCAWCASFALCGSSRSFVSLGGASDLTATL